MLERQNTVLEGLLKEQQEIHQSLHSQGADKPAGAEDGSTDALPAEGSVSRQQLPDAKAAALADEAQLAVHKQQADKIVESMKAQGGSKEQLAGLSTIMDDNPATKHQLATMLWRAAKLGSVQPGSTAQEGGLGLAPLPPATADDFLRLLEKSGSSKRPLAFVRAVWGWGNRLRSYDGIYTLVKDLGGQMVIVDNPLNTPKQFLARWGDLAIAPKDVLVVDQSAMDGLREKLQLADVPKEGGCEFKINATQFVSLKAGEFKGRNLYFQGACDARTEGLNRDHAFLKGMRPSPSVMALVRPTLDALAAHKGPTVGVHMRQGAVIDYFENYFFGYWNSSERTPPLFCCHQNTTLNLGPCPSGVAVAEKFVEQMVAQPENSLFFVSSDRPGCLLHMHATFPKKVLALPIPVEFLPDPVHAVANWFLLSKCKNLLSTWSSSFSGTAALVSNATERVVG